MASERRNPCFFGLKGPVGPRRHGGPKRFCIRRFSTKRSPGLTHTEGMSTQSSDTGVKTALSGEPRASLELGQRLAGATSQFALCRRDDVPIASSPSTAPSVGRRNRQARTSAAVDWRVMSLAVSTRPLQLAHDRGPRPRGLQSGPTLTRAVSRRSEASAHPLNDAHIVPAGAILRTKSGLLAFMDFVRPSGLSSRRRALSRSQSPWRNCSPVH